MPSQSIPANLYPLATQDGQAIPLDVINPVGAFRTVLASDDWSSASIPEGVEIAAFHAEENSWVSFSLAAPSELEDVWLSQALFVPAATTVISYLPSSTIWMKGDSAPGLLVIQLLGKWAALALARQYRVK